MSQNLVIPGIENLNTLTCIARSRTYSQFLKMVAEAQTKSCPFCRDDPTRKTLYESPAFIVWDSPFPEKYTRRHVLIAPRRHVLGLSDLSQPEFLEIWEIRRLLREKNEGIESCGILIRDGDATLSAGTIEHLHIHIIVPDGTERVEVPIFKGKASEDESLARAIVFEKVRRGTDVERLTKIERELVEGRMG